MNKMLYSNITGSNDDSHVNITVNYFRYKD